MKTGPQVDTCNSLLDPPFPAPKMCQYWRMSYMSGSASMSLQ